MFKELIHFDLEDLADYASTFDKTILITAGRELSCENDIFPELECFDHEVWVWGGSIYSYDILKEGVSYKEYIDSGKNTDYVIFNCQEDMQDNRIYIDIHGNEYIRPWDSVHEGAQIPDWFDKLDNTRNEITIVGGCNYECLASLKNCFEIKYFEIERGNFNFIF